MTLMVLLKHMQSDALSILENLVAQRKPAQGHWGEIAITAIPGFIVWGYGQFISYKATVRPQVVTSDGQKIEKLPANVQATVDAAAVTAPRAKTLLQLWAEKMGNR